MIEPNLKRRMTVEQALDHKWFKVVEDEDEVSLFTNKERDERVFRRIKKLKNLKKLQQEILLIIVSLLDDKDF